MASGSVRITHFVISKSRLSNILFRFSRLSGEVTVLFLPICFWPFARYPFEPIKVAFFVSTTTVMGLSALFSINLGYGPVRSQFRRWISSSKAVWSSSPLTLSVFAYFSAYLVATLMSINPRLSVLGQEGELHGTMTLLSTITFFALNAWACESDNQIQRTITALLVGSVAVSVYGLVQYWGLDPFSWITDSVSPVLSTMGRSNFLAAYLAIVLPFTWARIMIQSRRLDWFRYIIVLVLQVTCLFLTLSRGGWLAFIAGGLTFLWLLGYRWQSPKIWILSGLFLVTSSWLFVTMNVVDLVQLGGVRARELPAPFLDLREASVNSRIDIWIHAIDAIPEKWLTGWGPNILTPDPHNLLLYQLVSAGIVGLLTFLWVVFDFYWAILNMIRHARDRRKEVTGVAVAASGTAFLVVAQFNPEVIVLSMLFWLILSLSITFHRDAKNINPVTTGSSSCQKRGQRHVGI